MQASELTTRVEIGSAVLKLTSDFFHEQGFVQLLPVILGRSTDPLGPDPGSSIIKTPEIEYNGMLTLHDEFHDSTQTGCRQGP